jgi:beta-lactam-binding protein with PASTA domain
MAVASLIVAILAFVISAATALYVRRQAVVAAAARKAPPGTSSMPTVVGMKLAVAESVIRSAIADPQFLVRQVNAIAPPGTVISQSPAGGTKVEPGSEV